MQKGEGKRMNGRGLFRQRDAFMWHLIPRPVALYRIEVWVSVGGWEQRVAHLALPYPHTPPGVRMIRPHQLDGVPG